ncbi:MAG: choice-of-anchor B family protein [Saprospiraceae bacterium]|nr:choice-of-anchor B family protein [Saprospiraceae bacterium]
MHRNFSLLIICLIANNFLTAQTEPAHLLGRWYEDTLVGSSAYNNTYNEVWGLAAGGREFAIIGSTAGTHFIEVTDPSNPEERFFFPGKAKGKSIVHRDYETYHGYIYAVCDEGQSSLQIIDIHQMPDTAYIVYDDNALLTHTHNIEIDTVNGMLYTFATGGGSTSYSALRVYDLANPIDPVFIGSYNIFGDITAGHVHDGYIRNGLAYLNCGYDGMAIVDFTDPTNPVALGSLTSYPFKGYNHSGWGDESGKYYYLADENHASPIKTLDISDPANIKVVGTFDAEVPNPNSIPHNQLVRGDYLYVSYYYDGLVVFDISDPENPTPAYSYDTSNEPDGTSYKGAWGVYPFLPSGNILVSDMQEGLFVFEKIDPTITSVHPTFADPSLIQIYPNPVTTTLYLDAATGIEWKDLQLLDVAGRQVGYWSGQSTQIDLPSTLPEGLYFLHMKTSEGLLIKRIHIHGER